MKRIHIFLRVICIFLFVRVVGFVQELKNRGEVEEQSFSEGRVVIDEHEGEVSDLAQVNEIDSNVVGTTVLPRPEVRTQKTKTNNLTFDEENIPSKILHDIPFFPQAPDGNRSQPWQDACEEASIILAAFGLKGIPLSRDRFRSEINNLVALQNQVFGSYVDTTIQQTKNLYDMYYGIGSTTIVSHPTPDILRENLAAGNLIIAPFAGQYLGNIYYSNGGPRYHMLLIVGYDEAGFYTHDVGTKRGAGYWYADEVVMNALHDFVPKVAGDMRQGEKKVLSISY